MKTALFTLLALALAFVVSSIAQDKGRSFGDGSLPPVFLPYDVNKDGKLSEEEYQVMLDERDDRRESARDTWDNDGDGELSDYELQKAHEENLKLMVAKREQRFQEVDVNDDNKLSRDEFARVPGIEALDPTVVEAVFTRLDDNGDQLVGIWEFLEALEDRPSENTAHDYGKAEAVALEDLPQAVADALTSQVPNIVLERAKTREEDGELIYEVRGNDGITEVKAKIAADGNLRELELDAEISQESIPEAVLAALQELVGDFVIEKAETEFENGLLYYELEGHAGGREFEADFVADGRLVELEIEDAGDDGPDKGDNDDADKGEDDDPEGDDGDDPEGDDGDDPEGDDGDDPEGDVGDDPEGDDGDDPEGDDGDDLEGDDGDDLEGDDGDDLEGDDGDDPEGDDGNDPEGDDGDDGNDPEGDDGNDPEGDDGNDPEGDDGNDPEGDDEGNPANDDGGEEEAPNAGGGNAVGIAPVSLTTVAYRFTENGKITQADFLTESSGELHETDDPDDKDTFTYTYAQLDESSAVISITVRDDRWDKYILNFIDGTFTREEFDDKDRLKDTEAGTFNLAP